MAVRSTSQGADGPLDEPVRVVGCNGLDVLLPIGSMS
ncbi:hypothetical protein ACHAXS_008321, partial [Conticribra weissflogii]